MIPEHLLGEWQKRALYAALESSGKTDSVVYLVGGPVRDLLSGIPLGDLDLTVERHEREFVSHFANALNAEVTRNESFLTWKLAVDSERHVDLARLRSETYPAPGALPDVRPASSIDEDLRRRDFTVNAMAIRLDTDRLIDPFGGQGDLSARTLRILHDASFRDDPTRIFRGLRLASRCRLVLDPGTASRLEDAVGSGALGTVSHDRCWKEIDLACREREPVPVLRTFVDRRSLELLMGVSAATGLVHLPDNLSIPSALDPRIVLLGALLRGRNDDNAFGKLPYDRSTAARIRTIATRSPALAETLSRNRGDDHRLFAACEAASPEERFLAVAERNDLAPVVSRFDEVSISSLGFKGDDLDVSPGPWIGRAIRDTRCALFAGTIAGSDALAFARQQAMKYLND